MSSPPRRCDLPVGRRVLRAGHGGRRGHAELVARPEHEGLDLAPVRAQRHRQQADRVLSPDPGAVARNVIAPHPRFGMIRAVILAESENGGRGTATRDDAARLRQRAARHANQVLDEQAVEERPLRREERYERVAGGLGDRGVHRGVPERGGDAGVALVASPDGVDGVVDRDVDDGHGARGAAGPGLGAGLPVVARPRRRVVAPAGVDGDRVPVAQPVGRSVAVQRGRRGRRRLSGGGVARTEDLRGQRVRRDEQRDERRCLEWQGHGGSPWRHEAVPRTESALSNRAPTPRDRRGGPDANEAELPPRL